jgi:hypothetical protein
MSCGSALAQADVMIGKIESVGMEGLGSARLS